MSKLKSVDQMKEQVLDNRIDDAIELIMNAVVAAEKRKKRKVVFNVKSLDISDIIVPLVVKLMEGQYGVAFKNNEWLTLSWK